VIQNIKLDLKSGSVIINVIMSYLNESARITINMIKKYTIILYPSPLCGLYNRSV